MPLLTTSKATAPSKSVGNQKQASTKSKRSDSPANDKPKALVIRTNQKEQRSKKGKPKLLLDDLRQDVLDTLSDQLAPSLDPTLHSNMFSTDFKDHVEALGELGNGLVQYKEEILDCLDLLLKWCAFRLNESNLTSLKSTLEFLQTLFSSLSEDQVNFLVLLLHF